MAPDQPDDNPDASSSGGTPAGTEGPRQSRGLDWRELHLWQIQPVRDVLVFLVVLFLLYLGYVLSVVTVPLLLALLLAYLCEPLIRRITKLRQFSRQGACLAVIFSIGFLVLAPAAFGVAYGVVQGVGAIERLATNINAVAESVNNPDDQSKLEAVPEPWRPVREFFVEEFERIEHNGQAQDGQPQEGQYEDEQKDPAGEDPQQSNSAEDTGRGSDGRQPPGEQRPATTHDPGSGPPESSASQPRATPADAPAGAESTAESSNRQRLLEIARGWVESLASAVPARVLQTGKDAVDLVIGTVTSLTVFLFSAFLTAFFFFFISTGYPKVVAFFDGLLPEKNHDRILELARMMDGVIAGFIRGRLLIALLLGAYLTVAYAVIGVPSAFIVGPVIGALMLVPFIHVVGVPIAIFLLWIDSTGTLAAGAEPGFRDSWYWIIGAPIVVYFIAQMLDDYVLSPIIQGKYTDMDTPTILFSSIAGGALAGVYGILIAIPVAACLKILIREVFWPKFKQWREGEAKDFLPIERG